MASIKLTGDTSGEITISAPAVAGTNTLTLPAETGTVLTTNNFDLNGQELILDADADTSIHADTDDVIDFKVGGSDRAEIDSNGLEIKADNGSSTANKLIFHDLDTSVATNQSAGSMEWTQDGGTLGAGTVGKIECIAEGSGGSYTMTFSNGNASGSGTSNFAEHMRIKSDGDFMVGTTDNEPWNNVTNGGFAVKSDGRVATAVSNNTPLFVNRVNSDGRLVDLLQGGTTEGEITVSGSTVSYNGGHLARWGRLPSGEVDNTILKGTVMSNLDEMIVWSYDDVLYTEEDELPEGKSVGDVKKPAYTAKNEQRNEIKVSDVEGDVNVAGLFVSWRNESDDYNDIGLAMTGDMVIRIAQGTTVQRGDLLMSAGDGTAKPQGDDIVRSKTIAKVISTTVIKTYDDNSYLVPCVVMAC